MIFVLHVKTTLLLIFGKAARVSDFPLTFEISYSRYVYITSYLINYEYSKDLNINSMGRRIRTRLYFTSESHLHTVLNVFRFAQIGDGRKGLLSMHGKSIVNGTPELCYLTQVVMRVFEDSRRPIEDPRRFRMEILFSPGATATPMHMNELDRDQDQSRFDTAPLQLIGREGLTCEEVEGFFQQAIMAGRSDEEDYEVASSSTAAESSKKSKMKKKKKKDGAMEQPKSGEELSPTESVPIPPPSSIEKESSEEFLSSHPAVIDTSLTDEASLAKTEELSVGHDIALPPEAPLREVSMLTAPTHRSSTPTVDPEVRTGNDSTEEETRPEQQSPIENGGVEQQPDDQEDTREDRSLTFEEDGPPPSPSPKKTFSRKYIWGTVAVASIGIGMTCLVLALTVSNDARRARRWSSRR